MDRCATVATHLRGVELKLTNTATALIRVAAATSFPACPFTAMRRGSGSAAAKSIHGGASRSARKRPEPNSARHCEHCIKTAACCSSGSSSTSSPTLRLQGSQPQATGRSASAAISRVICTASVGIHGSIALTLCTSHIWSPRAGAEITMACPKGGATDSDSLCTADRAGHPAEPKTPPQNRITSGGANGVHSTELIEHGDALPVGRSPMLGTAVVGQYKLEISWRPATTARPPLIRHPELHCRTLLFLQRQEHR